MNKIQLTLLSLLAVALFVPQESKAVNWEQWAAIGAGVTFVGVVGYQIYESITASNEKAEKIKKEIDELKNEIKLLEQQKIDKLKNSKKVSKNFLSVDQTFTATEYAQEIKRCIESKSAYDALRISDLFEVVKEKKLLQDVLTHNFSLLKNSESLVLWDIAKGTREEKTITTEYENFWKSSKN